MEYSPQKKKRKKKCLIQYHTYLLKKSKKLNRLQNAMAMKSISTFHLSNGK
jgi:hypothetical protein